MSLRLQLKSVIIYAWTFFRLLSFIAGKPLPHWDAVSLHHHRLYWVNLRCEEWLGRRWCGTVAVVLCTFAFHQLLQVWQRHATHVTINVYWNNTGKMDECMGICKGCSMIVFISINNSFYSTAALLAMQSAVLAAAIPSVRLSVCHTLLPYPEECR